jgi:YgiT-type zinc finger domain-containing protein
MTKIKCNFCGSEHYEQKKIDYLYSYKGQYLLVPNTPVEICSNCGMIYYDAQVFKKIETTFFAIHNNQEKADQYLSIPTKTFSS